MIEKINQLLATSETTNVKLAIQQARSQQMGDECYYLLRFGEMLDYLGSFDNIYIIRHAFLPGAEEKIQKIERQIGKSLALGVRHFYEQCNGMQLFWLDKRNKSYEKLIDAPYPDYGVDGYIDIRGIDEIYNEDSLETHGYGHELIDRELSSEEVEATYHSFDYFSVYNDMMAYTGGDFADNPLLIMGDDHQACYTDARLMQIPSYLELVFHCCGAIEGRRRLLKKYNGHKLPILQYDRAWFEQYQKPDFNPYPAEFFFPKSSFGG